MKKTALIFLFAINSFLGIAQPLGYIDLPVVGELWIEFKDTVGSNITITPTGVGQTWNYLNSFSVHDTVQYLPQMTNAIPSTISNLFPQATTVDAGEIAGDYTFYKTDLTGLYIDGYYSTAGFDVAGNTVYDRNFTNDLLYIPVPFDTGYVVQNSATYSYIYPDSSLMPDALVRVTYTTFQDLEADAQGSLTTPLGTYNSTIRIKEMITETILYELDSFALGNFTYLTDFPSPTTYAYKWIKNGPNCLIMTATLDEFQNVTEASYFTSSGLVGIKNQVVSEIFSVIPNPVIQGHHLTINLDENNASSLTIFDIAGREVFQTFIPKGSRNLNVETTIFEPGIYYATVFKNNERQAVLKFTVIK